MNDSEITVHEHRMLSRVGHSNILDIKNSLFGKETEPIKQDQVKVNITDWRTVFVFGDNYNKCTFT